MIYLTFQKGIPTWFLGLFPFLCLNDQTKTHHLSRKVRMQSQCLEKHLKNIISHQSFVFLFDFFWERKKVYAEHNKNLICNGEIALNFVEALSLSR